MGSVGGGAGLGDLVVLIGCVEGRGERRTENGEWRKGGCIDWILWDDGGRGLERGMVDRESEMFLCEVVRR